MGFHPEGITQEDIGRNRAKNQRGRVESYPEDAEGRKVSMSYLNNGTVAMFEHHGFTRDRRIGKHRWVVHRMVPAP